MRTNDIIQSTFGEVVKAELAATAVVYDLVRIVVVSSSPIRSLRALNLFKQVFSYSILITIYKSVNSLREIV